MKVQQQGEVRIERIEALPANLVPFTERNDAGEAIISHSEKGHHHVLPAGVEVMERVDAPAGMKILYAIVKEPTSLRQTAGKPHEEAPMQPGVYELRISREFNPFLQQARRVAD